MKTSNTGKSMMQVQQQNYYDGIAFASTFQSKCNPFIEIVVEQYSIHHL